MHALISLRWPKCLIAVVFVDVDLPYWTSKVEHMISFTAIFSNICNAHAQKRLFMNFWCKFTIRYDTRCYFNVRSKADISQLNLPHGTDN